MLFVADPLDRLIPGHDSSVALMEAAQARGHEVWVTTADALAIGETGAVATARPVRVEPVTLEAGQWRAPVAWYAAGEAGRVRLADHELVWMRTDPPVDEDYLAATFVLDHADTTVVNDPTGLRSANEKLLVLQAPEVSPPTILTAARTDLVDFTRRHGTAVIKPVQGMAGRGILLLRESDPNLSSIIDGATRRGRRLVVAQAYLPECSDGDRRLILVGGEPLGVVRRLASGSDFRCNMATGAQVRADEVTSHDRDICRHLAPLLERHGLFFVGLDVIGDLVTEINVTSPTGLREVDLLSGTCLGDDVVAWAEGHVDRCRR